MSLDKYSELSPSPKEWLLDYMDEKVQAEKEMTEQKKELEAEAVTKEEKEDSWYDRYEDFIYDYDGYPYDDRERYADIGPEDKEVKVLESMGKPTPGPEFNEPLKVKRSRAGGP